MPSNKRQLTYLILQMAALLFIIFSGQLFIHNIAFLLMQAFGALFVFWALLAINLNKQSATNLPKGFFFETQGPYEIIRHPIYAGILLIMAGYVQGDISILRFLVFIALIVVTLLRISFEEAFLEQRIKEYKEYKAKTNRLIPYIY